MMSGCFFFCSEAAYSSFGPAQQSSSWCPAYQIIRTSGKSTFSKHTTKSMYSSSKIIIHSLFSISLKGRRQNGSSICIVEISHLTSQFLRWNHCELLATAAHETLGIWNLLKIGHLGFPFINQMLSCCSSALLAIGYWPFWDQSQVANGRNTPNYRWRMLLLIKEIWNKKQWEAHKRINTKQAKVIFYVFQRLPFVDYYFMFYKHFFSSPPQDNANATSHRFL